MERLLEASKSLNIQMKYQELKLQLKFHALFLLYTYTSLYDSLALQFDIFLKSRFLLLSYFITRVYFRHLLRAIQTMPLLNFF